MKLFVASLALAALLLAPAAPALALEEEQPPMPAPRVTSWFAPFDDEPGRTVLLFGLLPTPANEGLADRAVRLGAAAGLGYVAATDPFTGGQPVRIGLAVVGGVLGWTGLTGACPAYLPFGLNTRKAAAEAAATSPCCDPAAGEAR